MASSCLTCWKILQRFLKRRDKSLINFQSSVSFATVTMKIASVFWILLCLPYSFGVKDTMDYQVSLLIDGVKFCSGSLIREDFVITTADCVYKAFEVDVTLGITSLFQLSKKSFVCTSFIIPLEYEADPSNNNIALIKIPALNKTAYNINILDFYTDEIHDGAELKLGGFNLEENGNWTLQNVRVDEECEDYGPCEENNERFFALVSKADGDLTGYRNDGSAVIGQSSSGNVLVGVVVDNEENVAYALRISSFIDWIQSHFNPSVF